MKFIKIAVLTSCRSWFVLYAKQFCRLLKKVKRINAKLFFDHKEIGKDYEIVFILSYCKIIDKKFLSKHRHNMVVHESALPQGRGWSPLFWQILENKNKIPVVLFEAGQELDSGPIYIRDYIIYEGHELNNEIRKKQAEKTVELCLRFLDDYKKLRPTKQRGSPSFYRKRNSSDSELDINKSLKEQFNLLRIVDNKEFPAFFRYKGHKYILKIYKEKLSSNGFRGTE